MSSLPARRGARRRAIAIAIVIAMVFACGGGPRAGTSPARPAWPRRIPPGPHDYRLELTREGELHQTVLAGHDRVRPDRATLVTVTTYHSEWVPDGMNVTATVRRLGTTDPHPLATVRVDSTYADEYGHRMRDVRFVGSFVPGRDGEYAITARGAPPFEHEIEGDSLRAILRVLPVHATLTGRYIRADRDSDGDGWIEDVVVRPDVEVTEPGSFQINAELFAHGRSERAEVTFDGDVGVSKPEAHFRGKRLHTADFGTDTVVLQATLGAGPAAGYATYDERVLDPVFRLPRNLERGDIEFVGTPVAERPDADHDGRIDAMRVAIRGRAEERRALPLGSGSVERGRTGVGGRRV